MNYYYDTEFLEGTQKTFFGQTKPTIDLISIGIVSDGVTYYGGVDPVSPNAKVQVFKNVHSREYYAISKDFNLKEAWNRYDITSKSEYKKYWIRDNVLYPIFRELVARENAYATKAFYRANVYIAVKDYKFNLRTFSKLINKYGKTNKQIAEEVKEFCAKDYLFKHADTTTQWKDRGNPIFYGYYSAYDHVVLCWLFGKMIDLPKGFPMYTKDLKQIYDDKQANYSNMVTKQLKDIHKENYIKVKDDYYLKDLSGYPKQENEHNALADARFNRDLHKFLKTV